MDHSSSSRPRRTTVGQHEASAPPWFHLRSARPAAQTPKVVLMVISLTCQRLLLRTYALGADKCTTQYNQPKNTFAENCALDNAQAEVVQSCIRLCLPLSFVVLHAMLFLDQWMNFWRMWFHMCSCPLHRFFWLFSSSKLLHCPGMASLTAWSLAHKRSTGEPGGASKKQAGGSEKFLMKGVQLLAKLSLKNAMDIREIQSTVLTTVILNQDDLYVQAATAATQEFNKHQDQAKAGNGEPPAGPPHCYAWIQMLELLVTDGLAEEEKKAVQAFCSEHPSPEQMATVVHVCRVKKAFQKGKTKLCLAVHDSAEAVLQLLVKKLPERGGELKRGQAPKGGLERELQGLLDQLSDMLK